MSERRQIPMPDPRYPILYSRLLPLLSVLPHEPATTARMLSDYELSDDENEYYEYDDEDEKRPLTRSAEGGMSYP